MDADKIRILIVDDNPDDRELIIRILRKNYQVKTIVVASTVDEGIHILKSQNFDVILLDYLMPECDGIEMILRLSGMDNLGNTAIVMVSNIEDEEKELECLHAGAHDFLSKDNINANNLRKAILHARKRFELENKLKNSYEEVKTIAEKDALTGLSNRYYFEVRLQQAYKNFQRSKKRLALLILDLDNFKYVNDNHGHPVGDLLLKRVTRRISSCLRGDECFSRVGGDEFAIILYDITSIQVVSQVAKRILRVSEKLYDLNSNEVHCGVSIGIAISRVDGLKEQNLIQEADIAMYRAKKTKNYFCYFEKAMQDEITYRSNIEDRLRKAIELEKIQLHYQPITTLENDQLCGFEALMRWNDDKGTVYPDTFISIAEDSKLIIEMGRTAISDGFKQIKRWQSLIKKPDLTMAINLSPIQLQDPKLLLHIKDSIKLFEVDPKTIIFELTETALLNDKKFKKKTITDIRDIGCRIALDDFGTGFSSISYLLDFPIDIVKIDKSLMPGSDDDFEKKCSLIEGLTHMLQALKISIVVEGVEKESIAKFCKRLGINKGQGYFWGKPASHTDIEAKWLL